VSGVPSHLFTISMKMVAISSKLATPCSGMRLCCTGVFGGVAVYTFHDIHFTVLGYVWLGIWYSFAVFEMVYVKKVVDTVEMTTWSRTYYQARSWHSKWTTQHRKAINIDDSVLLDLHEPSRLCTWRW